MIDVDLKLSVQDGARRFDLAVRFQTDVPFAALYGPSGAGKSLTLQAIAGLLHPTSGHVRLDGRTLYDSARRIDVPAPSRRVGYLFQDYALFPHLTVRQNVAFGLTAWHRRKPAARDAERVQALLDSFGLAALADSRPRNLSGGQQQRVALARALACEPQVLLLDEPFAALNPMLRAELRNELAQVRKDWGIPVLMITHDIEDVLALADVAFVYSDGQVVREIDLHNAESRDFALRDVAGVQDVEDTPLRSKLRGLLMQDVRG
ncbi:ATP-binding cassette domain-containing protein [Variovorax sp. J22G73]|jgi:molybdate transport system ATP-binding protein|uniref:ABC transporter ATP-binding protein n=1 Tax=unclassified Variovorax TaxID=663243 RepID=UPI000D5FD75C|nr:MULTISPECIES: ATP-binding cassette domain-containing protein [unclassified Variovorax]MDM0007807.1 ATP-binding cassette domain-containing protein [Variovorax sp. J22R203]MDM0100570.1 ATP-binding cassette domain-containing protein [Variovorax sp. J22G73]